MEASSSATASAISYIVFDWQLILEYLKVLVWPIILILVVKLFEGELKGLINRINKGKLPGGIEFDSPPPQDAPQREIPKEKIQDSIEITREEVEINTTQLTTSEAKKQIEELQLNLIAYQIAVLFERTYKDIYGSQLVLLDILRLRGTMGLPYEDVASYYQQVRLKWSILSSYSLSDYLGFMQNPGLIESSSIDNRVVYKITPLGVDFLGYIESLSYTKEKAL